MWNNLIQRIIYSYSVWEQYKTLRYFITQQKKRLATNTLIGIGYCHANVATHTALPEDDFSVAVECLDVDKLVHDRNYALINENVCDI
jgi:hypothetical protein